MKVQIYLLWIPTTDLSKGSGESLRFPLIWELTEDDHWRDSLSDRSEKLFWGKWKGQCTCDYGEGVVVVHSLNSVQLFLTPKDCSTPDFPVFHQLPELDQTNVHQGSDAIQQSRPLPSPSPLAFKSFPASGSFPISQFFITGAQSIGASASVLPMSILDWFPLGLTGLNSLQNREHQESSPTLQSKSVISLVLRFLYGSTLTSIYDYWKNDSFD